IYKNRDINDYHHAHDAYIVALIGGFMRDRYPNMHDSKAVYSEYMKMFRKNKNDKKRWKDGFVINSMNYPYEVDGELIWNPDIINEIRKCFYYKDCYCTTKLDQKSGQMFNLTVLSNDAHSPKGTTEAVIPVNKNRKDVNKYGGFSGLQYVIAAIEGTKKKGKKSVKVRKLSGIPLYLKQADIKEQIEYVEKEEKLSDVKIIKNNIPLNQLIEINGRQYLLTSPTECVNAMQLVLNEEQCKLIADIYNAIYKQDFDGLDNTLMIQLYLQLIDKLKTLYPIYMGIVEKFEKLTEDFVSISKEEKANVIKQMLIIMHKGPQNGNIIYDDFNVGKRIGRLNCRTFYLDNIEFVSQSPTGIYTKKYKL
ncbi:type II CRISPR RNA-guided endonuclease Cas9, partial [Catenibacterium sp.]